MYIRKLKVGDRFTVDGLEVKLIDVDGGHVLLGLAAEDDGPLELKRLPTDHERRAAYRSRVERTRQDRRARWLERQAGQVLDPAGAAAIPPPRPAVLQTGVVHGQVVPGTCWCGLGWPHP